jgi:phosphatidate cytidylyltransferase
MLKQRIITALALLAVLLPVLWAPVSWPFLAFVGLAMSLAGWEWGRLNNLSGGAAVALAFLVLGLLAAVVHLLPAVPFWCWPLTLLVWLLGGAWALRGAAPAWARLPKGLRLALGPVLLIPAGLALLAWKGQGLNALLSALCLVWAADVAAYFGGRAFGRRKLAPAISPGKSWEGVWSGMLGVLLLAWLWAGVIDAQSWVDSRSLYGQLLDRVGWPLTVLGLLVLSGLSVVGDLFESLVKRAAGAKDSSQLLPGHGGVLDRIDALLPVLPAALALTVVTGIH